MCFFNEVSVTKTKQNKIILKSKPKRLLFGALITAAVVGVFFLLLSLNGAPEEAIILTTTEQI